MKKSRKKKQKNESGSKININELSTDDRKSSKIIYEWITPAFSSNIMPRNPERGLGLKEIEEQRENGAAGDSREK